MKSLQFILRIGFAWAGLLLFVMMLLAGIMGERRATYLAPIALIMWFVMLFRAFRHTRRVRFLADNPDAATFGSRHRRRIEMPFPAAETFAMVDAAIRELPAVEAVESVPDSLQIHARVRRIDPLRAKAGQPPAPRPKRGRRNLVHATIAPGESLCSLTLICEAEGGAWVEWFHVDDGTNFVNVEAITRAISRRIAERRKEEEAKRAKRRPTRNSPWRSSICCTPRSNRTSSTTRSPARNCSRAATRPGPTACSAT